MADSVLSINVAGIPDGTYMTVLDQADGTRVQREALAFTAESLNLVIPVSSGTTVKGYVDDASDPSSNGAYLEGITTPFSRYFTFLERVPRYHYVIEKPLVFTGDFEINFRFELPSTTPYDMAILGSTTGSRVTVDSVNERVRFINAGDFNDFDNALTGLAGGTLHRGKIVLDGANLTLTINDVPKGTLFTASLPFDFSLIGTQDLTFRYFNGIIADVSSIDNSGPLPVETLFSLDNGPIERLYELAPNNVVNGTFDLNLDGWASINNHSGSWFWEDSAATCDDDSNAFLVYTAGPTVVEEGETYEVSYQVRDRISGNVRARIGLLSESLGSAVATNGLHVETLTSRGTPRFDFEASFSSGFNGRIDNVELRHIINFDDLPNNNLEYSQGSTFGIELVSNNVFDDAVGWLDARGTATISAVDNKLRATADTTATFGQSIVLTGLVIGAKYNIRGIAKASNPATTVRIRIGETQDLPEDNILQVERIGSASADEILTATATTMYLGTINTGHDAGDYVEITAGITAVEILGNVVRYVNIPDDDRLLYTSTNDGLLGSDIKDSVEATANAPWVESPENYFSIDGSQTGTTSVVYPSIFSVPATFEIRYEVLNYAAGSFRINTSLTNSPSRNANGQYFDTLTAIGGINLQGFSTFSGDVRVDSIKRLLGVA